MAVLRRTRMSPSSDHPASDVVWDHARADLINHLPKKTHIRQVYYAAIDIFKEVNKLPEECKMLIIIPIINQTFDCKNQIFVPTVAFFIFLYATKLYFQSVLYATVSFIRYRIQISRLTARFVDAEAGYPARMMTEI